MGINSTSINNVNQTTKIKTKAKTRLYECDEEDRPLQITSLSKRLTSNVKNHTFDAQNSRKLKRVRSQTSAKEQYERDNNSRGSSGGIIGENTRTD